MTSKAEYLIISFCLFLVSEFSFFLFSQVKKSFFFQKYINGLQLFSYLRYILQYKIQSISSMKMSGGSGGGGNESDGDSSGHLSL